MFLSMSFEDAVTDAKNGVFIKIEVIQGTKPLGISGYNKWRKSIQVKLTEYARQGKANEQLLRYLSRIFQKPVRDVKLVSGITSSRKLILLQDMDSKEVKVILRNIII